MAENYLTELCYHCNNYVKSDDWHSVGFGLICGECWPTSEFNVSSVNASPRVISTKPV